MSTIISQPGQVHKVQQIIAREYDLEIQHKQHEVRDINSRLQEAERMVEKLRSCWTDVQQYREYFTKQLLDSGPGTVSLRRQ
mmetsp:Transcript_38924/g.64838  ORF Transcript_38924/g.64838 Transcript_38924/m.64838 type:complete len:82 (+) Transcript_38924:99-344(+)